MARGCDSVSVAICICIVLRFKKKLGTADEEPHAVADERTQQRSYKLLQAEARVNPAAGPLSAPRVHCPRQKKHG